MTVGIEAVAERLVAIKSERPDMVIALTGVGCLRKEHAGPSP